MAMISCGECGRQVSDKAAACPGCGNPIATAPALSPAPGVTAVQTQPGDAVTVEATGKTHKVIQIVGAAVFLSGMAGCTLGAPNLGTFLFVVGGVIYLVGGATAWWSHG